MDRVSEFEANSALQDALAAGGRAPLLRMTAHIAKSAAGAAAPAPPSAAGVQQRVQALGRLRLRCEPGWPLGLVVGEEMLAQYNSVFTLLLQVRQGLVVAVRGWLHGCTCLLAKPAAWSWLLLDACCTPLMWHVPSLPVSA